MQPEFRKADNYNSNAFNYERMALFSAISITCVMLPDAAYAGPMYDAICTVVQTIWGPLGGGMAAIAICATGGAAALGKASWGMALTVIGGMGIMMGAADMADLLFGSGSGACRGFGGSL